MGQVKIYDALFRDRNVRTSFLVFLNLNVFLLCAFCRCSLGLASCTRTSLAASDGSEVSPPLSFAAVEASPVKTVAGPGELPGLGSLPPSGSVLTDDRLSRCLVPALTTLPRVSTVVFRWSFGSDVADLGRRSCSTG